jgi:hypothetical protein
MGVILAAGGLWFLVMFALGFLLGPLREFVLAPRLGATGAVLVEAVPMVAAMLVLAPWAARLLEVPATVGARLGMGGVGLVLLVLAETVLDRLLRGRVMWAERLQTTDGLIGIALLALFALMPLLLRGRG